MGKRVSNLKIKQRLKNDRTSLLTRVKATES